MNDLYRGVSLLWFLFCVVTLMWYAFTGRAIWVTLHAPEDAGRLMLLMCFYSGGLTHWPLIGRKE